MATTTTNNAWPIPQSTDLVKDGATAIASLGSAIDTSLGAYTTKGKTLLSTTTLATGTTTISSINQTYTDLEVVIFGINPSTAMSINFKPNGSSSLYFGAGYRMGNGFGSAFVSYQNATLLQINQGATYGSGNTSNVCVIGINNYASTTMLKHIACSSVFYSGTDFVNASQFGIYNSTTALSSFDLTTSTGTFSGGTALVYGVR
jgi:hypothetical protein